MVWNDNCDLCIDRVFVKIDLVVIGGGFGKYEIRYSCYCFVDGLEVI